jgi:hypothetical protein
VNCHFRKWGWSFVALTAAFAIHVADEATSNAVAFYNALIGAVRGRYPFVPIPTLVGDAWLTGLVATVVVMSVLSVLAFRGVQRLKYPAYGLGAVVLLNSTQHVITSSLAHQLTPGTRSAPLLLIASAWILLETRRVAKCLDRDARDASH